MDLLRTLLPSYQQDYVPQQTRVSPLVAESITTFVSRSFFVVNDWALVQIPLFLLSEVACPWSFIQSSLRGPLTNWTSSLQGLTCCSMRTADPQIFYPTHNLRLVCGMTTCYRLWWTEAKLFVCYEHCVKHHLDCYWMRLKAVFCHILPLRQSLKLHCLYQRHHRHHRLLNISHAQPWHRINSVLLTIGRVSHCSILNTNTTQHRTFGGRAQRAILITSEDIYLR